MTDCNVSYRQMTELGQAVERLEALVALGGPIAELTKQVAELVPRVAGVEREVERLGDRLWSVAVGGGGVGAAITTAAAAVLYLLAKG